MLSAFGRFNNREGGGGGRVLSAFGRFNDREGGGGVDRVVHVHVGRSDGGLRVSAI